MSNLAAVPSSKYHGHLSQTSARVDVTRWARRLGINMPCTVDAELAAELCSVSQTDAEGALPAVAMGLLWWVKRGIERDPGTQEVLFTYHAAGGLAVAVNAAKDGGRENHAGFHLTYEKEKRADR